MSAIAISGTTDPIHDSAKLRSHENNRLNTHSDDVKGTLGTMLLGTPRLARRSLRGGGGGSPQASVIIMMIIIMIIMIIIIIVLIMQIMIIIMVTMIIMIRIIILSAGRWRR